MAKLQRASLQDPVKVEVSNKYQTVDKLQQYYIFIPAKFKVRTLRARGHHHRHTWPTIMLSYVAHIHVHVYQLSWATSQHHQHTVAQWKFVKWVNERVLMRNVDRLLEIWASCVGAFNEPFSRCRGHRSAIYIGACWPHVLIKVAPSPPLCVHGSAYDIYWIFSVPAWMTGILWSLCAYWEWSLTVTLSAAMPAFWSFTGFVPALLIMYSTCILFEYVTKAHKTEPHAAVVHLIPWGYSRLNGFAHSCCRNRRFNAIHVLY